MTTLAKALIATTIAIVSIGVAGGAMRYATPAKAPGVQSGRNWVSECIVHGDPSKREVAITFDDGPYPDTTPKILDILAKHDAKATFFVIGRHVREHPEIIKRMADQGCEVGNHTDSHRQLNLLNKDDIYSEYRECSLAVSKILGYKPDVCRPPGGDANKTVIDVAGQLWMRTVYWTVNPVDYEAPDSDTIVRRVLKGVAPGGLIILHDKVGATLDALAEILRRLEDDGYKVVTASDLKYTYESDDSDMLPLSWRK